MPLHIIKAIILAVMMFLSLQFLGFSVAGSAIFSLVPLLLEVVECLHGLRLWIDGLDLHRGLRHGADSRLADEISGNMASSKERGGFCSTPRWQAESR